MNKLSVSKVSASSGFKMPAMPKALSVKAPKAVKVSALKIAMPKKASSAAKKSVIKSVLKHFIKQTY